MAEAARWETWSGAAVDGVFDPARVRTIRPMAFRRRGTAGLWRRATAVGTICVFAAVPAVPAPAAHTGPAYWSTRFLVERLSDRRVRIGHRIVVLRADTLTCAGEGTSVVRHGSRMWTRFHCIQPTFPKGSLVGPDALFRVHVTSTRSYVVIDARMARY